MAKDKGLVIIHVDGLGYRYLHQAMAEGYMPFVQQLIARENYVPLRWRCGLPSTTPYVQAGLMFGDDSEIPSFRWWDKEANRLIVFGGLSTFRYVSDQYFRGSEPLLGNGAAIATCYTAEAVETYRLSYRQRERRSSPLPTRHPTRRYTASHVLAGWLSNPLHLLDMLRTGAWQFYRANRKYISAKLRGIRTADTYVLTNVLEEIFLHQLTRYATIQAMHEAYPIIYSAFYSYDSMAHAFGPESEYSARSVRHIDRSIGRIAAARSTPQRDYEILILSDHGQTETIPFADVNGRTLGQFVAEYLPHYDVEEYHGKRYAAAEQPAAGHVVLAYSGGLAHLYLKDEPGRLDRARIEAKAPGLIDRVTHTPGVGFVMLRDDHSDLLLTPGGELRIGEHAGFSDGMSEFLKKFDEPEIVAGQLHKLNSFKRSGDLVIFGALSGERQTNFENQIGGHGSLGGEQLFPFLLAKREWGFDTSQVSDACDLYPQLKRLRDRLVRLPAPAPVTSELSITLSGEMAGRATF